MLFRFFFCAVFNKPVSTFAGCPAVESIPVLSEIKERHGIATCIRDSRDDNVDKSACAWVWWKMRRQACELSLVHSDDRAVSVQTHDLGWAIERAKHHHYSAVLAQVSGGLSPAAGVVLISHLSRSENAESVSPFGG
jgi:hypothetical protein